VRRRVLIMLAGALPVSIVSLSGALAPSASAGTADRPDTRAASAHAAVSPSGRWLREALGSNADQDWFRFHQAATGRALVTLGHLAGNYSLTVMNSHGSTVAQSDRAGREFEEVYLPVSAGDYFVKVAADSGADPSVDYVLNFRPLPNAVVIAEQKELGDIDGFDILGELLNNTSSPVKLLDLHVTWLDRNGKVVGSQNEGIRPGPIAPHQRAEFTIKHAHEPAGNVPANATSYRIRVDAGTTTHRAPTGLVMTPTSNGTAGPQHSRVYKGTLTNKSGRTLTEIYPTVIEYDSRGRANAFGYDLIHSLAPGKTVSYKMFAGDKNTPTPNAIRLYASITGS
jgi:hypothetical protein